MEQTKQTNKSHILWLYSVKGLACVILFLGNFYTDYSYVPGLNYLYTKITYFKIFINGTFALHLFFIISAFLTAKRFLESNEERIGKSIFKRYFRMAFPFFVMDGFCIILSKIGLFYPRILGVQEVNYTVGDVLRDGFFDSVFRGSKLFNPSLELAGELFWGYIIAILFALIVKKMKITNQIVFLVFAVLLLLFIGSDYTTFVFGVLAYVIYSLVKRKETGFKAVLGVLMLIWGIFSASYTSQIAYFFQVHFEDTTLIFPWVHSWFAAMIFMMGIIFCNPLRKIMDYGVPAFMGRIGFPILLFQRVWEMSFGEKAYDYFYAMTQRNIDGIKASFVVTIFAAYTTGLIYFFLIEPHLNKMINALVSEIFSVERSREKN